MELTRQADQIGLQREFLNELWNSKQPVIISKPNAQGQLVQTTYSLTPDGQHILSEEGEAEPFVLSSTTSTTTEPPKVATNPQTDWEYLPSTRNNRPSFTSFGNNWPNFGSAFPSRSPEWPRFDFPAGVTPEESTKTELDNQGRTVTTTTKTYRTPLFRDQPAVGILSNWPKFDFPAGITPQVYRKTETDDQGRTVTTTVKTYKGTVPSNWSPSAGNSGTGFGLSDLPVSWQNRPTTTLDLGSNWFATDTFEPILPSQPQPQPQPQPLPVDKPLPVPRPSQRLPLRPTVPPTRPTVLPTLFTDEIEAPLPTVAPKISKGLPPLEIPTTTPLPSLDEFLKRTTPRTVETINVDDLPVFRSASELPHESVGTKVTSYRATYNGAAPPKTSDLHQPLQDALARGGITDKDIQDARARGEDLVRTRTLPDGRTIQTVVRVNSRPIYTPLPMPGAASSPEPYAPGAPPASATPYAPRAAPAPALGPPLPLKPYAPRAPPASAEQPRQQDKTIDNYLSQVNLSPEDILAQNGEVIRTIVDKDGRVLSVRFVLSTVKSEEQGQGQVQGQTQPTK